MAGGSFLKIDYALRPAKHTERRMLCEIFRRLTGFGTLSEYTYVGFGAVAFTDFILFHKTLGVRDMISIEREASAIDRIRANKPFNTISIEHKSSAKVLDKLKWSDPHILWMDYDDPLTPDMLLDVATIADHASSGTAVALSFQCERARELQQEDGDQTPFERFSTAFGKERLPPDTDETDLLGWRFGALGHKILVDEIESVVTTRNAALADDDKIRFQEICAIEYSDGAKMFTIVGVFVAAKDRRIYERSGFESLDFLPKPRKPIRIDIPKLTLREIRDLERQLPLHEGVSLERGLVPAKEAKAFAKLYRYLPNFAVLEN